MLKSNWVMIMENTEKNYITKPLMKNKAFGCFLIFVGILSVAILIYKLFFSVYEYDAKFYPVDYGNMNVLSYFTVQSNILVYFYIFCLGFAAFGSKKAERIAFNPTFRVFLTTYILVTGLVFNSGIFMKMSPPFYWDSFRHFMQSFMQVYHHMVIPPFMIILFFLTVTNVKAPMKKIWLAGVYPLVYSVFSIMRGALMAEPKFFAYPFFKPDFFWGMFMGDKPLEFPLAYVLMVPALFVGIGLFIGIAYIFAAINNKLVKEG